ncbi:hypothetical protein C9439_07970, partial [archaeon SCG-AAA382B04]
MVLAKRENEEYIVSDDRKLIRQRKLLDKDYVTSSPTLFTFVREEGASRVLGLHYPTAVIHLSLGRLIWKLS